MNGGVDTTIFAAFGVGMLSFFSPCVLPLVPGYLSAISGVAIGELADGEEAGPRRLLIPALIFVASFTAIFMLLGLGATAPAMAAISINDNNTHVDRGVAYTNSPYLTASGGTEPYTFGGSNLPSGLTLNSNGTLSGVTCGSNGTFTVPTTVTDSVGGTGSAANTKLIVNAAPAGGCAVSAKSNLPSRSATRRRASRRAPNGCFAST